MGFRVTIKQSSDSKNGDKNNQHNGILRKRRCYYCKNYARFRR